MGEKLRSDDPVRRNGRRPAEPDPRPEYDRFDDLARRLMQVPKAVVDKARKAAKA